MRKKIRWWFSFFLLLFLVIMPADIKAEPNSEPVLEHVFIISADGLNYEGLVSVDCTNLKHIASEGVMDEKSLALSIDTVEAAQASLLTGTFPDEHKFITSKDKVEVESLFDVLKKKDKSFYLVDGSGGNLRPLVHDDSSYIAVDSSKDAKESLDEAYKNFKKNKPFLTFIYVNDCREKLLTLDEKAYYGAVKKFDEEIGDFIAKLRKDNLYYNSLIVITSSRSSSPSDMVPLIIRGPGCAMNIITNATMTLDVLPTISEITGLPKPYSARGIPVYEAIDILPGEKNRMMEKWIAALKSERILTWNNYFNIQEDLFRAIRQIAAIREEKQNTFNFIGEKEAVIDNLKLRMNKERLLYLGIFILLVSGYFVEYRYLKKKFLLFK